MKTIFLAYMLPVTSIVWRFLYRGYHYAGFEINRAAQGLYRIESFGFWGAIKASWSQTRHCQYCGEDGIIGAFIPGVMLWVYPWEFWPHSIKLSIFALSFLICGIAFQLNGKQWAILALCVGASSSLLSYSIVGANYVTAFLPHSIAILIIFHPFFRRFWWVGLPIGLLAIEISWHTYALGKSIFVTFLLASFLQQNTPIKNRIVNLVLGSTSAYLVFSRNIGAFSNRIQNTETLLPFSFENISEFLKIVFIQPGLDIAVLPVLGIVALFFLKKDKLLFASILFAQWVLIVMLGFHGMHYLKPRRFIIVEFYNIIILLYLLKNWINKRYIYISFIIVLMVGNIWQFADLYNFTRTDITQQRHALPYIFSHNDFRVSPFFENSAIEIAKQVREGKKIILVYTHEAYSEHSANSVGLAHRLAAKLGYSSFKENVLMFERRQRPMYEPPNHPIAEAGSVLDSISDLDNFLVYEYNPKRERVPYKEDHKNIMKALKDKFVLIEQEDVKPFNVYKIRQIDNIPLGAVQVYDNSGQYLGILNNMWGKV